MSDELEKLMAEHLGVDAEGAVFFADKFAMFVFGTPSPFYDGPKDVAALDKLDCAAAQMKVALEELTDAANDLLRRSLIWGHFSKPILTGTLSDRAAFESFAKETGGASVEAISFLCDNIRHIREAIQTSRDLIEKDKATKKITRQDESGRNRGCECCNMGVGDFDSQEGTCLRR